MTLELANWQAGRHATNGYPVALLERIARPGSLGTGPTPAAGKPTRRPMTIALADGILALVGQAGLNGTHATAYLVDLLRWHYGYSAGPPIPPGKLRAVDAAFIRRRAYELVDQHRALMPHPTNDREAT